MISVFKKYAALVFVFGAFGSVFGASGDLVAMTERARQREQEVMELLKEIQGMIELMKKLADNGEDISMINMEAFKYAESRYLIASLVAQTVTSELAKSPSAENLIEICSVDHSLEEEMVYLRALNADIHSQLDEQRSSALSRASCQTCRKDSKGLKDGEAFSICGRCRNVFYCSRECQKKDWTNHKPACSSIEK